MLSWGDAQEAAGREDMKEEELRGLSQSWRWRSQGGATPGMAVERPVLLFRGHLSLSFPSGPGTAPEFQYSWAPDTSSTCTNGGRFSPRT